MTPSRYAVREPSRSSTPSTVSWRESSTALSTAPRNFANAASNSASVFFAAGVLDPRAEHGEALVGLLLPALDLLGGLVLRRQVAVLDVEVADDQVLHGQEVLADHDEMLQGLHVAVGHPLRAGVELAEPVEAHERREGEREREGSEGGAEAVGEPQVVESGHGPP